MPPTQNQDETAGIGETHETNDIGGSDPLSATEEDHSGHGSTPDEDLTSEQLLRRVLDSSPFPIAVVDERDQEIDFWSTSARELFGHNPKTTAEWYELAYPDPAYRKDVIERWKPFLEIAGNSAKAVNTGEYRIRCRDGSDKYCELYAQFIPGHLIVTLHDVTERKAAEQQLHESEERFRMITEASADAIFIVNQNGDYQYVNQAACALLGYTTDELTTMSIGDLSPPGHREMAFDRFQQLKTEGKVYFEMELVRKDGSVVPVDLNTVVLPNKLIYGSCRDITERKNTENELERRVNERTAELNRAVQLMAGREVRMGELKKINAELRRQLDEAGVKPK